MEKKLKFFVLSLLSFLIIVILLLAGFVILAIATIVLPVLYFWLKRGRLYSGNSTKVSSDDNENKSRKFNNDVVIDAEYEIIKKDK